MSKEAAPTANGGAKAHVDLNLSFSFILSPCNTGCIRRPDIETLDPEAAFRVEIQRHNARRGYHEDLNPKYEERASEREERERGREREGGRGGEVTIHKDKHEQAHAIT